MNIGLYQSASALSALERWQDVVAQNITSSQTTGYRKRTVNFSEEMGGQIQNGGSGNINADGESQPIIFPAAGTGVSFTTGETEPTKRDLDVAIQGDGFFEVQMADGSKAYTRSGEFRLRNDRTLETTGGQAVMGDSGNPIVLVAGAGDLTINRDGTMFQGTTSLGKISVQRFTDPSKLTPIAGGYFVANNGAAPVPVEQPELLQGYLEGSNVTPLREMVDMVLISRAYEANQKIISTGDETMQKTLDALG